jgi:hypothetical protein
MRLDILAKLLLSTDSCNAYPATPIIQGALDLMFLSNLFTHWLLLLCGFGFAGFGWKQRDTLKKYEFEHRSDGGTVGFKSYGSAKAHKAKLKVWDAVMTFGIVLLVFAVLWSNFVPVRRY